LIRVHTSIGSPETPRVPFPVKVTLPVAEVGDVRSVTVTPVIEKPFDTSGMTSVIQAFPHAVPNVVHVAGPGVPPEKLKKLLKLNFCPMLFCMWISARKTFGTGGSAGMDGL